MNNILFVYQKSSPVIRFFLKFQILDYGLRTTDFGLRTYVLWLFFSWEIAMGQKKVKNSALRQQEVEFSKINIFPCPYLNLVHAILQRELDDLVLDIPYNSSSWNRARRSRYLYLQLARGRAFSFFFSEHSQHFRDFLFWCDMGGFDYKQWQNKALLVVAQRILDDPLYFEKVVQRLVSKNTVLIVSLLLKNVTIH